MANTLIGLPNELKLTIYDHLKDLDDALHLSQTCKLFHGHKKVIQKQVIVRNSKQAFAGGQRSLENICT